jgi:hypothetical protein
MMKHLLAVVPFLMATHAHAYSDDADSRIAHLDKPYAVTHLRSPDVDCVWTISENGDLHNESIAHDVPGACFTAETAALVVSLRKAGKLVWNAPPALNYEYGDESGCYYLIDKAAGIVATMIGNAAGIDEEACRKDSARAKALKLAVKIERMPVIKDDKKVDIGGYLATKENILGSVLLACYTGSLDSDDRIVSNNERVRRFTELLDLYKDDNSGRIRVANAFDFADRNLRDRYLLDTEGRYRSVVCEQMVKKGKL